MAGTATQYVLHPVTLELELGDGVMLFTDGGVTELASDDASASAWL